MPQRTVKVTIFDGMTGEAKAEQEIELTPLRFNSELPAFPFTIQYQNGESGEWKTATYSEELQRYIVESTPSG